jgi:hypothetical protein
MEIAKYATIVLGFVTSLGCSVMGCIGMWQYYLADSIEAQQRTYRRTLRWTIGAFIAVLASWIISAFLDTARTH